MDAGSWRHLSENPFFVLGLRAACTRAEMEREGHKLLGMLELGVAGVTTYATPLGPQARTPELVRWAMAELRHPERRLLHELWAEGDGVPEAARPAEAAPSPDAWPGVWKALGWQP